MTQRHLMPLDSYMPVLVTEVLHKVRQGQHGPSPYHQSREGSSHFHQIGTSPYHSNQECFYHSTIMHREWNRQSSVAMIQLAEVQVMVMEMILHLVPANLSARPAEISCTRVVMVEAAGIPQEHQEECGMMTDGLI